MSSPQEPTGDSGRKNFEQITFRFCSECSNMLYPKEDPDSHKLQFTCRTCQYTEEASSTCVFRNLMNNAVGETAGVTQDVGSDPTVSDESTTPTSHSQESVDDEDDEYDDLDVDDLIMDDIGEANVVVKNPIECMEVLIMDDNVDEAVANVCMAGVYQCMPFEGQAAMDQYFVNGSTGRLTKSHAMSHDFLTDYSTDENADPPEACDDPDAALESLNGMGSYPW
ncbi:hypothetical protein G7054_g11935 [Neopestalotiopsis clavispora]|nr:hypothetical protein G7054_g11935 [Neopestalotiopsis clavispora]